MSSISTIDEKVLVLNRGYAAIRVVPARQAFTLLCREAAQILSIEDGSYLTYALHDWMDVAKLQKEFEAEKHTWLRLPTFEIAIPKIIRLLKYDKFIKHEVRLTRRNLFSRDKNMCQYCGNRFTASELTLDHVVPRVQGGGNSWANLVCACMRCNTRKGGRTPRQANMQLIHKPFKPSKCEARRLRIGSLQYQSWKSFLNNAYWTIELEED
ncbi:MAG: HNH endonuclease [Planctomycetes bacterium]|nr:HNH endonuclease [Planctomycetota bacterium]